MSAKVQNSNLRDSTALGTNHKYIKMYSNIDEVMDADSESG